MLVLNIVDLNVGLNVSNELYKIVYFMIKSNMEVCVCVQKKKYVS